MKVVGLTGGIGSGKSTVAKIFAAYGIPIFIADLEAKLLMETSLEVRRKIMDNFGEKSYVNERPDRKYLANEVFQNEKKLEILNAIIHPAVAEHFEKWKSNQHAAYVIYETAILFEKGGYKKCDFTILVTAPLETRIERVMKRDGSTRKEIEARMSFQWGDEKKIKLADFIIENISLEDVKLEITRIHDNLLKS